MSYRYYTILYTVIYRLGGYSIQSLFMFTCTLSSYFKFLLIRFTNNCRMHYKTLKSVVVHNKKEKYKHKLRIYMCLQFKVKFVINNSFFFFFFKKVAFYNKLYKKTRKCIFKYLLHCQGWQTNLWHVGIL